MQRFESKIHTITPDDDFEVTKDCIYKDEHYSVRDNGAVYRHAREGKTLRKDDNKWTFGQKNNTNGYMLIGSHRVHIIVATAFHGANDSSKLVVDHIDTNRCNNRPENLRWLTRLENALNNPATRKRIEYLCGGDIQKFINDPSCLRDATGSNQDIMWMRTVSKEEAKASYERVMSWATKPSNETQSAGGKLGEWIYQTKHSERVHYDVYGKLIGQEQREEKPVEKKIEFFETTNRLAVQRGWSPYTDPEFPCCPSEVSDNPLEDYLTRLQEGKVFIIANYGESTVFEFTQYKDKLIISTKIPNGVKNYGLAEVEWNGEVFIHTSKGTFFEENGVRAAYTIAQEQEWTGPDSIDDYC